MTIKDFMKANPQFVFGHKVKIMSREEVVELYNRDKSSYTGDVDYDRYYEDKDFIESADNEKLYGKEFVSYTPDGNRWLESGSIKIENGKDSHGWPRHESLPVKFIKEIASDNKPSEEVYDLINKVVGLYDEEVFLCMSTRGEVHGGSEITHLKINDTILPAFDNKGEACIMFERCGYAHNRLSKEFVKKLLTKEKVDNPIDTGMSFIRREYQLIKESEVKDKTFRY